MRRLFKTMHGLWITGFVLAGVIGMFIAPAKAAASSASAWYNTDFADVRLISSSAGLGRSGSVPIGLQFRLADGWKVYWRSAGDAGFPPEINWDGSSNLAGVTRHWPVPERFSLFGLESYGYEHEIVFPLDIQAADTGKPVALKAAIHALACSDICVPLEANLALTIGNTADDTVPAGTPFTQLISRFKAQVPTTVTGNGLMILSVAAVGQPKPHSLEVLLRSDIALTAPDVFPEAAHGFAFGKPTVELRQAGHEARLIIPASVPKDGALLGQRMTFTAVDTERFVERTMTVVAPAEATGSAAALSALLGVLGIAFLGGLILNLMPCVLPVLSLKLLSVVRYGGAERGKVRRGFLASAAGILTSFLILGGVAIALKQAGVTVGWGIQFQQPIFLVAMTALVAGFAANLAGLFEIPLPRFLSGLAGGGTAESSLGGHFATGIFATLLATPCSAPFLGTAIGFALARGPLEITVIFGVMGLGLAAPYLLVAAVPSFAQALPRTGAWMSNLQRVLALALAATAVWLLTVIDSQSGTPTAMLVGLVLVLAGGLLAATKWANRRSGPVWLTRGGIGGAAVIALLAIVIGARAPVAASDPSLREMTASAQDIEWTLFEPAAITQAVQAGKIVLVDVTADWCITCKVNKTLVLLRGDVREALVSGRKVGTVIAMKADWTLPDPRIADYLASFGRYGIPFDAVYGPGAPRGLALPEILTQQAVLDAISKAGEGSEAARRLASSD